MEQLHRLPVESPLVLDAPAIRELGEIDPVEQRLQIREELVKTGRRVRERCEDQPGGRDMAAQLGRLVVVSY